MGQQVLSESDGAREDKKKSRLFLVGHGQEVGPAIPIILLIVTLKISHVASQGSQVTHCWICSIITIDLRHTDESEGRELGVLSSQWVPATHMPWGAQPRNLPHSYARRAQA